jgi:myosin heavy subunit
MKTPFLILICIFSLNSAADASSMRSAAQNLRSQASDLQSRASSIRSETSSLRSNTSSVNSERSRAEQRRQNIDSEISQLGSDASMKRNEASQLNSQAMSMIQQKRQVDAQNQQLKGQLTTLLRETYKLQALVDFKESEKKSLDDFQNKIAAVNSSFDNLNEKHGRLEKAVVQALDLHSKWMTYLAGTAEIFAPHFKELVDEGSIKAAAYKIKGFVQAVPAQKQVTDSEDEMLAYARRAGQISSSIQDQLREIARSPGLAVYNKYASSPSDGTFWRKQDEDVYKNADFALKTETLINLLRERRGFLVRVIPAMWERMLNVRLDSVNLQRSVRSGTTGMAAADLSQLVLQIHDQVDNVRNQALLLFYKQDCPLLGRDRVNQAVSAANRFLGQLASWPSTSESQGVKSSLLSKQTQAQRLQAQMEKDSAAQGEGFYRRRIARMQQFTSAKRPDGECAAYANTVLNRADGRESEIAFRSYLEKCQ